MTDTASTTQHGHASEKAYQWIRQRILGKAWPDGAPLKESDLSQEIGVSRTPVREALRRLTLEGLVETVPNQGSRLQRWNDQDLNEIFGLRVLLESYAARLAAKKITADQLEELDALCDKMDRLVNKGLPESEDRQELTMLNERFHNAVFSATHNGRLKALAAQIISFPLVYRTFEMYDSGGILRSMAHHRELVDAFTARDAVWAESVMRAHLSAGHHATRRSLVNHVG